MWRKQMVQNYNPYSNMYLQDLQNMRDRIDKTIQQYQHQPQQPTMQPITQNFQLSPTPYNMELEAKYANNIDEVKNTFVVKNGIFITKDFSNMWFKDTTGNIRVFNLEEVIELDDRDKKIQEQSNTIASLQLQINNLKEEITNAAKFNNSTIDESTTTKKSTRISNNTKSDAE